MGTPGDGTGHNRLTSPRAMPKRTAEQSNGAAKKAKGTYQAAPHPGVPMRPGGFTGGMNPAELKFVDNSGDFDMDTTGDVLLISNVAQGADYNQRVGRQFDIKSVSVKGYLVPKSDTLSSALARLMLVWDAAPNAVAPTISDILTSVSSVAFPKLDNRNRFRILKDELIPVGRTATSNTFTDQQQHVIDWYLRFKNPLRVFNKGPLSTIGDVSTGALFLVSVGSGAAGTDTVLARLQTRIRFTDT